MVRVFANGPGRPGFNPRSSHIKESKKWYLMPPCLTLSIIRYGSRVKWVNPGKGVVPSPTPWCSSYRKGSLQLTLNYSRQLYFTLVIWDLAIYPFILTIIHVLSPQIKNKFKKMIMKKVTEKNFFFFQTQS